jgi:hypothetical protein
MLNIACSMVFASNPIRFVGHVEQHSQFNCRSFCGSCLPTVTRKEKLEGLNIQAKIVVRLLQSFCDPCIFHVSFFFFWLVLGAYFWLVSSRRYLGMVPMNLMHFS